MEPIFQVQKRLGERSGSGVSYACTFRTLLQHDQLGMGRRLGVQFGSDVTKQTCPAIAGHVCFGGWPLQRYSWARWGWPASWRWRRGRWRSVGTELPQSTPSSPDMAWI